MITALLSGCASCNLFTRSTACDIQLLTLGLIAPVIGPVIKPLWEMQDKAKKQADEVHAEERRQADYAAYKVLKQGVENNDLLAIKQCVFECKDFFAVSNAEKSKLARVAIKKLIEIDSVTIKKEDIPIMLLAYSYSVWDENPVGLNSLKITRGWELALMVDQAESNRRLIQRFSEYMYALKVLALPESEVQEALEGCVKSNLLPVHPGLISQRHALCEKAYEYLFETKDPTRTPLATAPKALKDIWRADAEILRNERLMEFKRTRENQP